MNETLEQPPGMIDPDRMTWSKFALLIMVGVVTWVGVWHIARDVYRWTMGILNCE